jgi:curved DNA-binding protein
MEFKDYYQTLGVAREATTDDIKKAYRKLARKYHPDVSKEANAESRFKEIGEAYEVLKDPEKRSAYDQFGSQWKAGQDFRPPPDWNQHFEFRGGPGGFSGAGGSSGFSDFFETLFGDIGRGQQRAQGGARAARAAEDQHAKISIDLEDSFQGATRAVGLQAPEIGPAGQLVNRSRNLNVKIPKGVTEGRKIRLSGQGGSGHNGQKGDLILEITFREHPLFRAEERNIYLELPVTPWEAALGETVTVPTLGGKVDLKIPPGAQSGQKLRLKGRGLPGDPAGDQYVVLKMVTPKADSETAKALYEKMAKELPMNPRAELGV